jgi:hypothetical protein
MKFLPKKTTSVILTESLQYKKGQSPNNRKLLDLLLSEQKHFCAYTEEVLFENTLCPEVEHFNADLKYKDDYYNYYVVSKYINKEKSKKDRKGTFKGASFFESLFFHNAEVLSARIKYEDGIYQQRNVGDTEARQLIDYIGLNDPVVKKKRDNAIRRLKNTISGFTKQQIISYFKQEIVQDNEAISFITAIEHEFDIKLSDIIND